MSEQTLRRLPGPLARLFENPVAVKELRSRMRGRRAFVILVAYLTVMSVVVTLIYAAFLGTSSPFSGPDRRDAGQLIFGTVLAVQVAVVAFIGPAFTAYAITGEKERQTFELLRTTLLSPSAIVKGKLISALSYVFLLVLASVPLQSLAFFLGGIDWVELVVSQILLVLGAITFALVGLYASARMRSSQAAGITAYSLVLMLTGGLPALAMILLPLIAIFFSNAAVSDTVEILMTLGAIILAATNLPITIVLSEIFLISENAVLGFTQSVGGVSLYIISPWVLFIPIYVFLSWLLFRATVRRVARTATR